MKNWIDFKELRARLVFADVLRHYGVEVKAKGEQHHGFCPLPNHGGQKRSASFSANLTKGIFHCFGCGAKGNALDLGVSSREGVHRRGNGGEVEHLEGAESSQVFGDFPRHSDTR